MSIEQFLKSKKQELLSKHAKYFAAGKKEKRTPFQGIRYEKNGTAYVTDTHILLRIRDVSPFPEPRTLHAITGAELEGTYPSEQALENLLTYKPENRIILDTKQIKEFTQCAKIAQMIGKELKADIRLVELILSDESACLEVKSQGNTFNAPIGNTEKYQSETWAFNADYLYNALNLFKNAGSTQLVIKLKHKYDPILFSDVDSGIDVLILPVRSNW